MIRNKGNFECFSSICVSRELEGVRTEVDSTPMFLEHVKAQQERNVDTGQHRNTALDPVLPSNLESTGVDLPYDFRSTDSRCFSLVPGINILHEANLLNKG